MTDRLLPGRKAPNLTLPRSGDSKGWSLNESNPDAFTMLLFYRGAHCPICKKQLQALDKRAGDFRDRGVEVVAISCDDELKAARSRSDWEIEEIPVLFDLSLEQAREWGLYISEAIGEAEPRRFAEPGIYLLRPDGTVYAAWIQSSPFARPRWEDVLGAIEFVKDKDYPPRGIVSEDKLHASA